MAASHIDISLDLDDNRIPQSICWTAAVGEEQRTQTAKAMLLAFWDGADKSAVRLDLWTSEMMVDEMSDFFFQTLITMADTYDRATHAGDLAGDIRSFAREFQRKFRAKEQSTQNTITK